MLRLACILTAIFVSGLALQACAPKVTAEASCGFVQNSDLQRVSWGSQIPVVMYIDNSVPTIYADDIKAAADVWNKNLGREVLKIGGYVSTHTEPAQDGHNIIYYMSTWEPDKTVEQARTTVYWAGDRIYEADVRINASSASGFSFTAGNTVAPGAIDMQSLIIHEFGHVLGLAHSVAPGSVMAKSLPNNVERRTLSASDEESVRCEY